MEELEINKVCNSYEEQEELMKKIGEEYNVMCFNGFTQEIGEPEIYGIKSIIHFGKR